MKRVLTIDLDYDLADLAKDQPPGAPKIPSNSEITRNIIEHTYITNYPKMKAKLARQSRLQEHSNPEYFRGKRNLQFETLNKLLAALSTGSLTHHRC